MKSKLAHDLQTKGKNEPGAVWSGWHKIGGEVSTDKTGGGVSTNKIEDGVSTDKIEGGGCGRILFIRIPFSFE